MAPHAFKYACVGANKQVNSNSIYDIVIDSGGSNHFLHNAAYFTSPLSPQPTSSKVETATGVFTPISAGGDFLGMPALYTPSFKNTLFSVPTYTSFDNVCIFNGSSCYGFKNDSPILQNLLNNLYLNALDSNKINMSASLINGLYKTSFNDLANYNESFNPLVCNAAVSSSLLPIAPSLSDIYTFPSVASDCSFYDHFAGATTYYKSMAFPALADLVRYWHEALSHLSVDDLCYVVEHYPMDFPKELTISAIRKYFPACAACAVGSLSQLSLPTTSSLCTADIGEDWFIDVWTASSGTNPITSFSGGRYSFLAKCRKSKFLFAHIISTRQQLFKLCEKLYVFCKSKGRTMRRIITDNEFLKTEILEWVSSKIDLTIHACIPHEHGQIGQIEREHRTLMDGVVKALYGKPHLSMKFWALAYMDCLFKRSLLPRRSLNGSSPYYEWHGRHVNLQDTPMLPFGSIVMAHIPLSQQTNLGGRAFETYSVGCAPAHKEGLSLFNPITKRYVIRRTVKVLGPIHPVLSNQHLPLDNISVDDDDSDIYDPVQFVDTSATVLPIIAPSPVPTISVVIPTLPVISLVPTSVLPIISPTVIPPVISNLKPNQLKQLKLNDPTVLRPPYKPRIRRPRGSAAHHHSAFTAVVDSCVAANMSKPDFDSFVDHFISSVPLQQKKSFSSIKSTISTSIFTPYRPTDDLLRNLPAEQLFLKSDSINTAPSSSFTNILQSTPTHSSYSASIENDLFIPRSCQQALLSPLWSPTIDSECDSFRFNTTYKLPDVPISSIPKNLILPSKAVFDIKYNPDGSFKKRKCRICIRGDRWVNYHDNDTYAGTARTESIKMILALSAELDLELESYDVKTAFLLPPLKEGEIIYMRRPAGLTDAHMPEVVQLLKCIYGLPLASAYFREHSDNVLKSIGFKQTISDPQVYILRRDKEFVIVATHVDDFEVAATSSLFLAEVKSELSKSYELSSIPDMSSFLGLNIVRNREKKTIFINQPGYIADLITDYKIDMSIVFPLTPMRTDYDCHISSKPPSTWDALLPPAPNTDFRSWCFVFLGCSNSS